MVFFKERVSGRSNDTVEMKKETFVSLDKNGKGVKIKTRFDNEVKDHRVRIMVPTGINSDVHKADSVFVILYIALYGSSSASSIFATVSCVVIALLPSGILYIYSLPKSPVSS